MRAQCAGCARARAAARSEIGFGPACNRGAQLARGDALLFLNPDCLIEPRTIADLRAICENDRSIGLLGIDIVSPDGHAARGNRRREPTLRRALMTISGLARLEATRPAFAGIEMRADPLLAQARVAYVEAVSGACLFMPRRVFDEVGGFDAAYFCTSKISIFAGACVTRATQ